MQLCTLLLVTHTVLRPSWSVFMDCVPENNCYMPCAVIMISLSLSVWKSLCSYNDLSCETADLWIFIYQLFYSVLCLCWNFCVSIRVCNNYYPIYDASVP